MHEKLASFGQWRTANKVDRYLDGDGCVNSQSSEREGQRERKLLIHCDMQLQYQGNGHAQYQKVGYDIGHCTGGLHQ